ncbi:MAG: hypothetical protein ACLF0G_12695 [Candidatus Brocadiia bacterium]
MKFILLATALCLTATAFARPARERALKPYVPPPAPDRAQWPRERLLAFMGELADFIYEHHVVRDPRRPTYGMTYEFYRDGKWIQVFGLDTMHDGAWFTSAMVTAHRAHPQGETLERAQRYQIPFYTHMLNHSDRLFPQMKGRGQDKKPLVEPVKGWAPRGWDDGAGYDKTTGQRFQPGYHTTSNHLLQDLADMLLDVWMATRDPAAARAAGHIQAYKGEHFGTIPHIEFAAAATNGRLEVCRKHALAPFRPAALRPAYTGLYEQKGHALPSGNDGLAWEYRRATARFLLLGEPMEGFALRGAASAYAAASAMELYFAHRPYPHGIYFFDIQRPAAFVEGEGKLDAYASTARKIYGARGIQISWIAAACLPVLARHPELWEATYRKHHAEEPLVRIVDAPPETDGARDEAYDASQALAADGTTVHLLGDPRNLHLYVQSQRPRVAIAIRHAGHVVGEKRTGRIEVQRQGTVAATNDRGEPLLHVARFQDGEPWAAELRIPYTVVPGQAHWINGVDHGRYEVSIHGGEPRVVYMLSKPARIVRRLEHAVLGTVDTWHRAWKELGCIPSGYRSRNLTVEGWELSDAGNAAHLVKTIALWLIYLEGTSEWELIQARFPDQATPAPPLPDSVLQAQGLK